MKRRPRVLIGSPARRHAVECRARRVERHRCEVRDGEHSIFPTRPNRHVEGMEFDRIDAEMGEWHGDELRRGAVGDERDDRWLRFTFLLIEDNRFARSQDNAEIQPFNTKPKNTSPSQT